MKTSQKPRRRSEARRFVSCEDCKRTNPHVHLLQEPSILLHLLMPYVASINIYSVRADTLEIDKIEMVCPVAGFYLLRLLKCVDNCFVIPDKSSRGSWTSRRLLPNEASKWKQTNMESKHLYWHSVNLNHKIVWIVCLCCMVTSRLAKVFDKTTKSGQKKINYFCSPTPIFSDINFQHIYQFKLSDFPPH